MRKLKSSITAKIILLVLGVLSSIGIIWIVTTNKSNGVQEILYIQSEYPEVIEGLILRYKFDELNGRAAADTLGEYDAVVRGSATWLEGEGIELDGEDDYIELPQDILGELSSMSISVQVYVDPSAKYPSWLFTFASTDNSNGDERANYLGLLLEGGKYRVPLTKARWASEENTIVNSPLARGRWQNVVYTQEKSIGSLYVDGIKVAENRMLQLLPKDIINTHNYIGKAPYLGDQYFKGKLRDFRIYNRVLDEEEIQRISGANDQLSVARDIELLTLENINNITQDINLPTVGEYGSHITWSSQNTDVVGNDGSVYRPACNERDKKVKLIATITKGEKVGSKVFETTIKRLPTDEEKVVLDKDGIIVHNAEDIRGNVTLPQVGQNGSTIVWTAEPPIITPTGEVTRPEHGTGDQNVTLVATITSGNATETREFTALVKEMPAEEPLEGYLFAYFIGEGYADGEQVYFALSEGNNPLKWNDLHEGKPVLTAELGEEGVRDPVIIRSPEGDKFYLIATDLKIHGNGNWGAAQKTGSKCIFVWESTDLINWSKQRLVQVSPESAGNTWAPEVIYDDEAGEYIVYWSSRIYTTPDKSDGPHNRIMYARTRDFYTFTPAEEYFNPGFDVIDTVMIKENGKVYRFTKAEQDPSQNTEGKMIFQEVGSSIFADDFVRTANDFVKLKIRGVEGPLTFKDNLEDKWYLFVDEFGGRGYIPYYTTDLENGAWVQAAPNQVKMPTKAPRHGTVLPITASEYARLKERSNEIGEK